MKKVTCERLLPAVNGALPAARTVMAETLIAAVQSVMNCYESQLLN